MRRYSLSPPGGPRRFPAGCRAGKPIQHKTPTGLPFLDALGAAMRDNPPPARDQPLLRRLATVGVGPGLRPQRAHLSAAALAALVSSIDQTSAQLPVISRLKVLQEAEADHGWATIAGDIGDYGTDYLFRAEVADLGIGANTPKEAVYPTALTDASGQPLNGDTAYRLVFRPGQAPPNRAFWSLTMYDLNGFLVANPLHRYAVGDTHPPLRREPNGSIVVLIQHSRPTQPHVNWLPSPLGPFRLNLRIYRPTQSVLDGHWQPPPVEPVSP
jgi:hypothetical protein